MQALHPDHSVLSLRRGPGGGHQHDMEDHIYDECRYPTIYHTVDQLFFKEL